MAGLAVPHERHHHHSRGRHQSDRHQVSHDSQLDHKSHPEHHSSKHRTTTGAQREKVPTPLQDFVLMSGSPLFHERPRVSDSKINATEGTIQNKEDLKVPSQGQGNVANQTAPKVQGKVHLANHTEEANQLPKQEQNLPSDLSKNATSTTSGPVSEQLHENGAAQQFSPAPNAALKHPKEFAVTGLNEEKGQQISTLQLNSGATKNSSSDITIGPNTQGKTFANGVDQGKIPPGTNASLAINPIAKEHKKVNGNGGANITSEMEKIAPKENQTKTFAADVKPEAESHNQGVGNFPFNIPGVRNYENKTTENKGVESSKLLIDKETLGPNCHWKTTTGENGKKITTLSCSGEFKKPNENKIGMDIAGKNPLPGDSSESKQTGPENTLVSVPGGHEEGRHVQSKSISRYDAVLLKSRPSGNELLGLPCSVFSPYKPMFR